MEYITITSAQNPAVKHLVKLRDRRTRDKENLTILEGYRELTRSREYGMELVECFFSPEPGNLGSMLRSADAAGADALIVCERKTDLYNPNVIRASTGAIFSVPVAVCDNEAAMKYLKERNIKILAATPHTDFKYTDVDLTQGVAIVVGAEQTGLTDFWMDQADLKVNIPMLGKIDSLNVASAATILLYEAARQRNFRKR